MGSSVPNSSGAPARTPPGYRIFNLSACFLLSLPALTLWLVKASPNDPDTFLLWGHRLPQACIYKRLTGRPCLGCGMTRGLCFFFKGEVDQAQEMHPSATWVGSWLAVQIVLRLFFGIVHSIERRVWLPDVIFSLVSLTLVIYLPIIVSGCV